MGFDRSGQMYVDGVVEARGAVKRGWVANTAKSMCGLMDGWLSEWADAQEVGDGWMAGRT
jgi:hypothetical protein